MTSQVAASQPTGRNLLEHPVGYDLERLSAGLAEFGYSFEHRAVTKSTMSDAGLFGLQRGVAIADHQTAGRGREGRAWQDEAGRSILMTIAEPWNEAVGDPARDSILPGQIFVTDACLALREITGSAEVQIKWLNDLLARGKKLGGVLLNSTTLYRGSDRPYSMHFGIGINVSYAHTDASFPDTDYGAISLHELVPEARLDMTAIVLAIIRQWQTSRNDLKAIANKTIYNYHESRWRTTAALLGRTVRISGYGPEMNTTIVGKVIDSPLNGSLILVRKDGTEYEVRCEGYSPKTKVEVLEAA